MHVGQEPTGPHRLRNTEPPESTREQEARGRAPRGHGDHGKIYISNKTQSQNRSTFHRVKVCGNRQSKQVGWRLEMSSGEWDESMA